MDLLCLGICCVSTFGLSLARPKSFSLAKQILLTQDTYLLFDGHELVITRSIRRIATAWRGHLAFYMNFRCWSWEYKTGFGGRILPTKAQPSALTASGGAPAGDVEPSAFFDEDAEAVRQKHLEEVREETELSEMTLHDKPLPSAQPVAISAGEEVSEVAPKQVRFPNPIGIFEDTPEEPKEPQQVDVSLSAPSIASGPSSSAHGPPVDVPQTPDVFARVPTTPRAISSTRQHETEPDDHDSKRARVETAKKQRLERISAEYETMVRTVKFADESFHTMDEYSSDLSLDDHLSLEAWLEEEKDESPIGDMESNAQKIDELRSAHAQWLIPFCQLKVSACSESFQLRSRTPFHGQCPQ